MVSQSKYTIDDVAKAVGVSKATVSYVLNQRESGFRISAATKLNILKVCEELNYRPDQASVLLAQCRNAQTKLLVLNPWVNDNFSELTYQLNRQLQKKAENFPLNVNYCPYGRDQLSRMLRPSLLARFDAVLVVGASPTDERFLAKNRGAFPQVVLLNRQIAGYSSAFGNDAAAMRELIHQIDLEKYRRFVVFRMPTTATFLERRCDGFARGIADFHHRAEPLICGDAHYLWQLLSEHCDVKKTPTLAMVPLYGPAAMLMKNARRAGVKVPEELGIIAYDVHTMLEEFIDPAITTVDPCLPEMINAGIELACRKKGETKVLKTEIKAVLKLGGSTCNRRRDKKRESTVKSEGKSE